MLVWNSRALAEAAGALVQQMTDDSVTHAIAAGADGAVFGTDAAAIAAALEAGGPAGGLVLMDLGTTVLSAGLAPDLIDPDLRARVRLSQAPMVEGAVAACARAAAGATLHEIAAEAARSIGAKAAALGGDPETAVDTAPPPDAPRADATAETWIADPCGLHARPAAALAILAAGFTASVLVSNATTGMGPVTAGSMLALSSLGVRGDHRVHVTASGHGAKEAVAAVVDLLRRKPVETPLPCADAPAGPGFALPTVPGIALGPIFRLQRRPAPLPPVAGRASDPAVEAARLAQAVEAAGGHIKAAASSDASGIFDVHLAMLHDRALLGRAHALIADEGMEAAAAWRCAVDGAAAVFAGLEDPYQRARTADVRDVGDAVMMSLAGGAVATLPDAEPCVLLADGLVPSEAARLNPAVVLGVIDRAGASTSHAAVLLRAAGIPTVSGAALVPAEGGTVAALDGVTGEVWIDPSPKAEQTIRQREAAWRAVPPLSAAAGPAVTRDGQRVRLLANVSGPSDASAARAAGAEGIGLMRTEMLFLDRVTAPDDAEQAALVAATLEPFRGLPVVVRTLDAGGDKPLPYLSMPREANPYLGVRGIRLGLMRPEVLLTQLRALLVGGLGHDLHIMFPMVATLGEMERARALLEGAHEALAADGRPHAWPVKAGAMIEVPAAALTAGVLARVCDFFSIGTNDLTQYTLAAERGHPGLQGLADAAHPAVLQMIQAVVAAGRPVAVCGDAASDPEVAALLLAIGVSELSIGAAALGSVRAGLGTLSIERARAALPAALTAASAAEARAAVRAAME